MLARSTLALILLTAPLQLHAQHAGGAQSVRMPPSEVAQFAFLVGEWELSVHPAMPSLIAKLHGVPKLVGTWKGWRAFDGFGIEDEMRITDESGNPRALSHAMRYYDASTKRWSTSSLDVYRGAFTASTAEWRDGTMTVMSHGTNGEGKPTVSRAKYYDITPTSFRFRQDRLSDDGKSWTEGVLTIDAKRVAAVAPR
ncbi:MAG: hypothetical protein ABJE10_09210 [bacterium]